jgi:hypothetical protein
MAGCGSSEENSAAVKPTASTPQPAAQAQPKTPEKPQIVAQNPQKTRSSSAAGLIQPTNANQRTQQVQTGRSDPFAGLFTIAPPKVVAKPRKVAPLPKIAVAPPPRAIAPLPPAPPIAPPQPDLARGVVVMGIVEVGGAFQAIVQVPNEATSRYVSEGQRLSDGQVLVKRIEINSGSEPFVILEQNGIEVTRAVGEEPAKADDNKAAQPTAAIPAPTLSVTSPLPVAELKSVLPPVEQSPAAIPVPPPPAIRRSSTTPLPPSPALSSPSPETELKSNLKLAQPSAVTPLPPSLPTSSQPSEAELQSKSQIDRPLAANSVPPSLSGATSGSRTEQESKLEAELESHLELDYPPAAIRDTVQPSPSRQSSLAKLRRRLKLN